MNFDNYIFRASSIGNIMAGTPKPLTDNQQETFDALEKRWNGEGRPLTEKQQETFIDLRRKKNAKCKLTDGAKTFLEKLVWEEITGRREELKVKYLDKGIQVEEKSITIYSKIRNKLFIKNKERRSDEFFTGEPDNVQDIIRDIKSSWSYSSFPLTSNKITNSNYEWQLQVYMHLWNLKNADLIYCLVDTPHKLIEDELRRMDWNYDLYGYEGDIKADRQDLVVETICNHIFTLEGLKDYCNYSTSVYMKWFEGKFKEIPEEIRVKVFEFEYSPKMISQAKDMIILARKYMNQIVENIGSDILKNENLLLKA